MSAEMWVIVAVASALLSFAAIIANDRDDTPG